MTSDRRRTRRVFAALALAVAALGACAQVPPPATSTPRTVAAPTGHRFVGGDSLTVQASESGQLPPADYAAGLGWRASHVTPRLYSAATDPARSPRAVVIALGQNYGSGFDTTARNELTVLAGVPHDDACVSWLLPAYYGPDVPHYWAVTAYRDWARRYAGARAQPVTDWADFAVPGTVAPDGVHLTTAGRVAYAKAITQALAACDR